MCSHSNPEANFLKASEFVKLCSSEGAKLICLPECFGFMGVGTSTKSFSEFVDEGKEGPFIQKYKKLAQEFDVFLSLGGY